MPNFLSNLARRGAGVATEYRSRAVLAPSLMPPLQHPAADAAGDFAAKDFRIGEVPTTLRAGEVIEEMVDRPAQTAFHSKLAAKENAVEATELRAERTLLPSLDRFADRPDSSPRGSKSIVRPIPSDDGPSPFKQRQSAAARWSGEEDDLTNPARSSAQTWDQPILLSAPDQQFPNCQEAAVLAPAHPNHHAQPAAAKPEAEPEAPPSAYRLIPHTMSSRSDVHLPNVHMLPQAPVAAAGEKRDRSPESQQIQVKIGKVEIRARQAAPSPRIAVPKGSTGFQDFALRRAHLDRNYS